MSFLTSAREGAAAEPAARAAAAANKTNVARSDGAKAAARSKAGRAAAVRPPVDLDRTDFVEAPQTSATDPSLLDRGEMLELVKKLAADMALAIADTERLAQAATRERDAIRASCIKDHLARMRFATMMGAERYAELANPRLRNDEISLRHEFSGVELAHQRTSLLHLEAMECAGDGLGKLTGTAGGGVNQPSTIDSSTPSNPSSVGTTSVDPAGANTEMPMIDRPAPASVY